MTHSASFLYDKNMPQHVIATARYIVMEDNLTDLIPPFVNPLLGVPYNLGNMQKIFTSWFSNSTTVNNNFAGNWPIEERVITDVASYGAQLGWISEIVLALAKNDNLSTDAVKKLAKAAKHIDRIKHEFGRNAAEKASDALDRLKKDAPGEFRKIVSERYATIKNTPDAE